MIDKTCTMDCEQYERRSTAVKRKASHRTIMAEKNKEAAKCRPIPESAGVHRSRYCRHLLVEKIGSVELKTCTEGPSLKPLDNDCPKNCPYREKA
jgi:hypothetical protein